MDIMQLVYFKTVAETGHLTNAAKQLNIAQPALSVSIARLEDEVGTPLFDRVGRRICLNKCGEIYLEYVRTVLNLINKAQLEVDAYCNHLKNVLNIGVVAKPFPQIMINEFTERFPNSKVRQITLASDVAREDLLKGEIDCAITNGSMADDEIEELVLCEERVWVAVPASHPLAASASVQLGDLREESFINLPREYNHRALTDEMCVSAGFTPNVVLECFHCHTIEMVACGAGVALVTEERVRGNASNSQIAFLPIENPAYTMKYYILWRKASALSTIAENFRDYAAEYFKVNAVHLLSCDN